MTIDPKNHTLALARETFITTARKLRQMVAENNSGGWSTNNNKGMEDLASSCYRLADDIGKLLEEEIKG